MKIFGLIIAILIWLMTAFGCEPRTSFEQTEPTPAPTSAPAAQADTSSGRSSSRGSGSGSSHGESGHQTSAPTQRPADGEDTLMPEINDPHDHDDDTGYVDVSDGKDTLLPEL